MRRREDVNCYKCRGGRERSIPGIPQNCICLKDVEDEVEMKALLQHRKNQGLNSDTGHGLITPSVVIVID